MNDNTITKYALINGLSTALYVVLIGLFFHFAPVIFNNPPNTPDTVFVPIFMLSLFVFSAALCGSLVLGRPILWYLDGKKQEAVKLFSYTLGILFIVVIVMFILVAFGL